MATKSRLGRGLGALFPALPGEQIKQPTTKPAAPAVAEIKVDRTPARTVVEETAIVREPAPAVPVVQQNAAAKKGAAQEAPAGPISPLSSTIPSMGTMSRNADTVSTLARPMTLQPEAAEHRPVEQSEHHASHRAIMPAIDNASHPSDVFFDGTPVLTKEDLKRAGIATAPTESEAAGQHAATSAPKAVQDAKSKDGHSDEEPELQPVAGGYLVELNVQDIGPNLYQPRTVFDTDELEELSNSIKEVGVLQPIVVRERPADQIEQARAHANADTDHLDSKYELVMGERRWRASQLAGFTTIPAIVKTTADDYMLRDALLENLHRVALNPLEEAAAYQQMIDEFGLTQMQLAKSVSKSRPQIANTLRLMNLPASVQKDVIAGKLSAGHARALLGLPTDEDMEALAARIIDEGLSVRSVEEIVSMKAAESDQPKKPKANRHNPWAASPIPEHLSSRFSTKVSIKGSKKHGRIEIVFSSPEEMERIVSMLMPQE